MLGRATDAEQKRGERMEAFKAIAQRTINAEESFISCLMEFGDIDKPSAERAYATLRKAKATKMDAVSGVIRVKHGAFLDRDVIRRAAEVK